MYVLFIFIINLLVSLSSDFGNQIDLGNDYDYFPAGYILGPNDIPNHVVAYNCDNRHIIAIQVPEIIDETLFPDCKASIYFKGYDYSYYWIIDKERNIRYGPYSYECYVNECRRLKVEITFDK